MKIMKNGKRLAGLLLAMIMLLTAGAVPAWAENAGEVSFREWETDIRLSITPEAQLREEAGMDLAAWDKAVEQSRQNGLSHTIRSGLILAADSDALVLKEDGEIFQLGASSLFGPVTNALDAYCLAYRLAGIMGGSAKTVLALKSRLTMNDTTVWSFQQIFDGEEVLGGTLKIAVDGENAVTAVFSCLDAEASREQVLISREEAEALVVSHCEKNGLSPEVLDEYTDRVFHGPVDIPTAMNLDVDLDPVPDQVVWIVYTANEGENADQADVYPYLAHYVQVNGNYLYSLPVSRPSDEEALCGFRKPDVFAGLEPDTYTGEITDINGNVRTVTVPVMRSEADNCWYLGDVENRIAFADFVEAAYGENHDIVLVKSEDNSSWDSEDIYALYNYLRAFNFYADMGWDGPDGQGTDVLIFKGMAYSNGMVYPNACSLGKLEGWQVFAYSPYSDAGEPLRLTWGLDVMAHEFTHTFTGTVMNQNLYENDLGAINEAMSDILGNLVEYICEDTDDSTWLLGENTGSPLRCMTDPKSFAQPAFVWDMYYGPETTTPNTVNDRGGVHFNSSLLNLIAARLCTEYGMSYGDAVSFWVMTAMGMTPRTDYYRMVPLLNWALKQTGLDGQYQDALDSLVADTRIDSTGFPESLPEGQKLVRLVLPDTEAFHNKEWVLFVYQFDIAKQSELREMLANYVTTLLKDPDQRRALSESLQSILNDLRLQESELDTPSLTMDEPDEQEQADPLRSLFSELFAAASSKVVKSQTEVISWEENDTGIIPAVVYDQPSLYMLMNVTDGGSRMNKIVILLAGSWYDLTDFIQGDYASSDETTNQKLLALSKTLGKQALSNFLGTGDAENTQPVQTDSQAYPVEYLPTDGLESIQPFA